MGPHGFYCLGFVVYVLNRWRGASLPDPLASPEMWKIFRDAFEPVEHIEPGDMLLLAHPKRSRQHVGIVENSRWVADCNATIGSVGRSRLADWFRLHVTAHRLKP